MHPGLPVHVQGAGELAVALADPTSFDGPKMSQRWGDTLNQTITKPCFLVLSKYIYIIIYLILGGRDET